MSSVKLVSKTCGVGQLMTHSIGEILTYVARVSNPNNQMNRESSARLLEYCFKHGHWSVFEHAGFTVEIVTSRAIAQQILRHRSFTFQEFCVTGDTKITTILPSTGYPSYVDIKTLYERQGWRNYKNINLRVYDQKEKKFTTSKLKEVFFTGVKPVFSVTLSDGKNIKCTKDERFLTKDGFFPLEDIVDLKISENSENIIITGNESRVAVNGDICYQNKEWMSSIRKETPILSLTQIAERAKTSTHTIRKYLRIHGLQFTKKEVAQYSPIWNKGLSGYKTNLVHSEEHLAAIRKARSGPNSNLWKGGANRSERLKIADWCGSIRNRKLKEYSFCCICCGGREDLELDHIVSVDDNKELAYCYDNIQVLCNSCHVMKHSNSCERKKWRSKSRGNTLVPRFVKIQNVKYIGMEDTYDLEVMHDSHNYVANKILVHNSQRYAEVDGMAYESYDARRQDRKNRQNSIDDMSERDQAAFLIMQQENWEKSCALYKEAIGMGIAKEQARFLLPLGTQTRLYMTGNVRSWITYCQTRCAAGVQLEHQEIAVACRGILLGLAPELSDLMLNYRVEC